MLSYIKKIFIIIFIMSFFKSVYAQQDLETDYLVTYYKYKKKLDLIEQQLNLTEKRMQTQAQFQAENKERNKPEQDAQNQEAESEPGWLQRTAVGVNVENNVEPKVYVETVQPLYQSDDKTDTYFTHGRASINDGRGVYSLGVGYRKLFGSDLLLGVNSFYDYQDLHQHYRTGVGLEALTNTIEARVNTYYGLSPKRQVDESITSTEIARTYEEVVDGFDAEVGGPLPYFPWLKFFGGYYKYDYRHFKDMKGWKMRLEIRPTKTFVINVENYDDNKGSPYWKFDSRICFRFDSIKPKSLIDNFLEARVYDFARNNVVDMTLARVERDFDIKVEKWQEIETLPTSEPPPAPVPSVLIVEIGRY